MALDDYIFLCILLLFCSAFIVMQEVFLYLHKYFVFLLKTGGKRMTECMVEGPPQVLNIMSQTVSFFFKGVQCSRYHKIVFFLPSDKSFMVELMNKELRKWYNYFLQCIGGTAKLFLSIIVFQNYCQNTL